MKALGKPFKGLVVISAGFDASEYEQPSMQRHAVNVPTFFYNTFTKDALKLAQMHSHGKVLSVMEGGYSDGAITSGVFAHLIGLQNQSWINEWGSAQVVKEIVRGCKPNWKPYKTKRARDVIRIWAEEVIKLGRAMIPEFERVLFEPEIIVQPKPDPSKRITRSKKGIAATVVKTSPPLPRSETPTPVEKRYIPKREIPEAEPVPFVAQDLPSDNDDDEEDEDYVYDEELNKTFNRTVEDITIDDISRHLETLDIEPELQEHESRPRSSKSASAVPPPRSASRGTSSSGSSHSSGDRPPLSASSNHSSYKIPSGSTTRHLRNTRASRLMNFDDSDISMISHVSPAKGHSTRSGQTKW